MPLKSKRILQICLSPAWGGLEMVTFEFARDFRDQGIRIVTLCLDQSPLHEKLKQHGLPFTIFPSKGFLTRFKAMLKAIRDVRPDTIICQHLHDLWFLVPVISFKKMRTIGLSHTFLGVSKKDFLHTLLYRKLDRMICLTGLHKQNILENLNISEEKLAVIPNMVDTKRFSPTKRSSFLYEKYSIPKERRLIGVVGRLDERKGQQEAIQALHRLRCLHSPLHLLIIGEDTLNNPGTRKRLEQLVLDYGLENRVTFTGHIEDIEATIASLDILLVPSSAETFGRIIIEGMASGVPVISTRAGGVPDIITDRQTGLLVNPNDSEDLALAIQQLIAEPELSEHLHEQALQKVRSQYSCEIIADQLQELIIAL